MCLLPENGANVKMRTMALAVICSAPAEIGNLAAVKLILRYIVQRSIAHSSCPSIGSQYGGGRNCEVTP